MSQQLKASDDLPKDPSLIISTVADAHNCTYVHIPPHRHKHLHIIKNNNTSLKFKCHFLTSLLENCENITRKHS